MTRSRLSPAPPADPRALGALRLHQPVLPAVRRVRPVPAAVLDRACRSTSGTGARHPGHALGGPRQLRLCAHARRLAAQGAVQHAVDRARLGRAAAPGRAAAGVVPAHARSSAGATRRSARTSCRTSRRRWRSRWCSTSLFSKDFGLVNAALREVPVLGWLHADWRIDWASRAHDRDSSCSGATSAGTRCCTCRRCRPSRSELLRGRDAGRRERWPAVPAHRAALLKPMMFFARHAERHRRPAAVRGAVHPDRRQGRHRPGGMTRRCTCTRGVHGLRLRHGASHVVAAVRADRRLHLDQQARCSARA
jgi:hypothetical protein